MRYPTDWMPLAKVPILKLLKNALQTFPHPRLLWKKIVGTDNKGHTEWDVASWVSLHANTYSISSFGFLAVFSHCLEKFSKMENEKFCLKEKWWKKKKTVELLVFKLNLIMSIYALFIQILYLLYKLRVLYHCPNWNASWGESKGFRIVVRVLPA